MAKANVKGLLTDDPPVDMVNHPPHYCFGKFESADVLDDWFPKDPHIWTAVKYLSRYEHKGKPIQDLQKAIWYINRRIGVLRAEGFTDE